MPLSPIENVGTGGIVSDLKPYQLQPNEWSKGNNVAFNNAQVHKIHGYGEVMKDCPIEPWHLATYQAHNAEGQGDEEKFYWFVFGEEQIYCYWMGAWYNSTRLGEGDEDFLYRTDEGSDWDVTQSGALLIATNSIDIPQIWELDEYNNPKAGNRFKNMESWVDENTPEETDLTCRTVEGFKNHIVVTGIDRVSTLPDDEGETENNLNRIVKWSTQHSHYKEPNSWNVIDKTKDAGEYELLDTQGPIIDTLPMGEVFMIYKTDSVYMMNYVGTPWMFSFKTLDPQIGIIAKGAATEFPGGHFFISHADCYINNGQTITPLLTGKVRAEMFNNISGPNFQRIFAITNTAYGEVWACFPTANSEYCDRAMVWNYNENTFSFRDLPNVTDIKHGLQKVNRELYGDGSYFIAWEAIHIPWSAATEMHWGAISYANIIANLVMCEPKGVRDPSGNTDELGKIYRDRIGQLADGRVMHSFVERTGIDMGDPSSVKHLRAIWPKIWTATNAKIDVYTGSQMGTDESVAWDGPYRFYPDKQSKISTRTTGKLLAIRFETTEDTTWSISGIELELESAGSRGSRSHA